MSPYGTYLHSLSILRHAFLMFPLKLAAYLYLLNNSLFSTMKFSLEHLINAYFLTFRYPQFLSSLIGLQSVLLRIST